MALALPFQRIDKFFQPSAQNLERDFRLKDQRRIDHILTGCAPVEPGPGFGAELLAQFRHKRWNGHAGGSCTGRQACRLYVNVGELL